MLKIYLLDPGNSLVCIETSYNHVSYDFRVFINATLDSPARLETLGHSFFILRLTHPTTGIKHGSRIQVCDYSTSSVPATLDTFLHG